MSPEPLQYNTVGNGWFLENRCYAIKCYENEPVPNDLCSHIDHSVDLTGDGGGDDELYYSPDDEYDSDSDGKANSDQYININLYYNAYN